jgi:hypothetical protein
MNSRQPASTAARIRNPVISRAQGETVDRLRVKSRTSDGGSKVKSRLMKIEMWPVDKPVPYAQNADNISNQAFGNVPGGDRGSVLPFESDSIALF